MPGDTAEEALTRWPVQMRRHRLALKCVIYVLALLNLLFFVYRYWQESEIRWLLRMPEVERTQLADPDHILFSSEGWDPRVPASSVIDPAFDDSRPSMLRDILACRPLRLTIDSVGGDLGQKAVEMPTRFYVSAQRKDGRIRQCLTRLAPKGYTVEPAPRN